jgi:hypothetical protein
MNLSQYYSLDSETLGSLVPIPAPAIHDKCIQVYCILLVHHDITISIWREL